MVSVCLAQKDTRKPQFCFLSFFILKPCQSRYFYSCRKRRTRQSLFQKWNNIYINYIRRVWKAICTFFSLFLSGTVAQLFGMLPNCFYVRKKRPLNILRYSKFMNPLRELFTIGNMCVICLYLAFWFALDVVLI